jgi:tetratricopeptide (TPR) repeat protein
MKPPADEQTRHMTCEEIRQSDVMEQYLLGRLESAARDDFDEHLFECDECFERLQTLRALRHELAATATARGAEPARASLGWIWNWKWALTPMLAALLVAVSVSVLQRATPPSEPGLPTGRPAGASRTTRPAPPSASPSLAELGRFQPPTFAPTSVRGVQDAATARFRDGMKHYANSDYRGALPGLRAAAQLDPDASHATFFLGVCYVLTGQREEGIRALRQTIGVGDSPYLEEAHFYLAKAFLQNDDPVRARQEVERTIRLRGALENEARQLLAALDRLPARQ